MSYPTRFEESTVDLATGIQMHLASAGDPTAPPLVLLHGFTDSWASFGMVLPLLARTHRVLAVDLRGHGDSSTDVDDLSIQAAAADVVALMDYLEIGAASVLGHSMGSFVARQLAVDFPDRVDRLMLIGSGARGNNGALLGLSEEILRLGQWIPEEFVREFQTSCVFRPDALPCGFLDRCIAVSRRTPRHVWRSVLPELRQGDQHGRLGELRMPVLIVGGAFDSVFPVAEQEELARQIPSSQLRLYRYAGHSPHWEEPARVAEDLQDFLSRSQPAKASCGHRAGTAAIDGRLATPASSAI
jgi:pimeloyl-ACP methyl ester carboxylesterase